MQSIMKKIEISLLLAVMICLTGCVEREIKITTNPSDAEVCLNQEQIGPSPVSVHFNWYGVYHVKVSKPGYQTINVQKELKRPAADYFPLDLFADIFTPNKLYTYDWYFELEKESPANRDELIERALQTDKDMTTLSQGMPKGTLNE